MVVRLFLWCFLLFCLTACDRLMREENEKRAGMERAAAETQARNDRVRSSCRESLTSYVATKSSKVLDWPLGGTVRLTSTGYQMNLIADASGLGWISADCYVDNDYRVSDLRVSQNR